MSEVSATPRRRSWRWLVILAATLLSHLLVLGWAGGYLGMPALRQAPPPVASVTLIAPPAPPKQDLPLPAPKPPAAAAKPKTPPKKAAPAPAETAPAPAPAETGQDSFAGATAQADAVTPQAATGEAAGTADPAAGSAAQSAAAAVPEEAPAAEQEHKLDLPPSARLDYEVTALRDGQQWYGAGSFAWHADGGSYSITGEASVTILFKITVLNFRSEGAINEAGIAPVLYSEKPWRKAMTSTHFSRQEGKISFSASNAVYPYQGGEQDRASIAWQLAAMGRGDPSRFIPGAEIDVMVAGARNADRWKIRVVGEERIATPHGSHGAWHLRREPRAGSRDQGIDFWLAPQLEWYPVRVRYTYANNDYLDLSLSDLTPAASPTTP